MGCMCAGKATALGGSGNLDCCHCSVVVCMAPSQLFKLTLHCAVLSSMAMSPLVISTSAGLDYADVGSLLASLHVSKHKYRPLDG